MGSRDYDYFLKLLIIGDSAVGKSCLLLRFTENEFTNHFITTIGIDFKMRTILVNKLRVKLQIWDTAGQERFRTITSAYYRGAHGILLVYDCGNKKSFEHVKRWIRQIKTHANKEVVTTLVANKFDLPASEKVVSDEEGRALAAEYNMSFMACSAKTDHQVSETFELCATEALEQKGVTANGEGAPSGAATGSVAAGKAGARGGGARNSDRVELNRYKAGDAAAAEAGGCC